MVEYDCDTVKFDLEDGYETATTPFSQDEGLWPLHTLIYWRVRSWLEDRGLWLYLR